MPPSFLLLLFFSLRRRLSVLFSLLSFLIFLFIRRRSCASLTCCRIDKANLPIRLSRPRFSTVRTCSESVLSDSRALRDFSGLFVLDERPNNDHLPIPTTLSNNYEAFCEITYTVSVRTHLLLKLDCSINKKWNDTRGNERYVRELNISAQTLINLKH